MHEIKLKNYSIITLILAILFAGCSVSNISIRSDKLGGISKIAILPFVSTPGIPESVKKDSEDSFKKALVKAGFTLIDEKSSGKNTFVDRSIQIDKQLALIKEMTGADAVLSGYIPVYREESKIRFHRSRGFIFHTGLKHPVNQDFHEDEIAEIKTFYFKIHIEMISLTTGDTILTMENRYSNTTDESHAIESLDEYKRYILKQMCKDLIKAFTESGN